jgi:hypothetical protein
MYKKSAFRQGNYKIVRHDETWSLFNVVGDLAEANNLATSEPQRLQDMIKAYEQVDATMMAPLF